MRVIYKTVKCPQHARKNGGTIINVNHNGFESILMVGHARYAASYGRVHTLGNTRAETRAKLSVLLYTQRFHSRQ